MEKRELSKIDFDMIDEAFKALLQSNHPDPVEAAKARHMISCPSDEAFLNRPEGEELAVGR